ncbi:hypothetical protein [Moraxella lacunata]
MGVVTKNSNDIYKTFCQNDKHPNLTKLGQKINDGLGVWSVRFIQMI